MWIVLEGQHKLQHQNSAQSCSGSLGWGAGGSTCPIAAGPSFLPPFNYRAFLSHPSSRGRSGAEQSPKPGTFPAAAGGLRWGDREHPALLPHSTFLVPCTTVLPDTWDRGDTDTATAAWSPTSFLGCAARLGRVLLGLGQPLAVLAQPACPHSHSSVPAGPQSVELSQDRSSTHPAPHQLCSKPCGAGRWQRRVSPGSLPRGWEPACRCRVPG